MGYKERAEYLCEKVTPEQIAGHHVADDEIQDLRDCLAYYIKALAEEKAMVELLEEELHQERHGE